MEFPEFKARVKATFIVFDEALKYLESENKELHKEIDDLHKELQRQGKLLVVLIRRQGIQTAIKDIKPSDIIEGGPC